MLPLPAVPAQPGRVRTRRAAAVLAVVVLLAAGTSGWAASERGSTWGELDGPVHFDAPHVMQRAGVRAVEGGGALFGATVIVNSGDSVATLTGASLIGEVADDAVTIDEVRVVSLGPAPGSGDLLGAAPWLDREWSDWWASATPVEGARVAPGEAAELVFVLSVHATGDWVWPGTSVDYSVGGRSRTATTRFGFQICPPDPARCSGLSIQ